LRKQSSSSRLKERFLTIFAKSRACAQKALNLIISSIDLYDGQVPWLKGMDFIAYSDTEPKYLDPEEKKRAVEMSASVGGISLACAIAAKASRKEKFVYGIAKYAFSISLFSIPGVDLEPSARHIPIFRLPDDHIKLSHAIISAYSAIEELGLEIRASSKKPSKIKDQWNPAVKSDLEQRLMKAKININENMLWMRRGTRTKIERKKSPPISTKAPWAGGLQIRDCDINLIEAISLAHWLRSHVASHKTKDLTKVISPYDVINVQHLARRLLLEILGFWKFLSKE
jgi:hypothetical protein